MLNDPSFKEYLKEKWDNGHAMVPHPAGGGKLIEMLSAYTGYPAYREHISGLYQQWLNQKNQFDEPPENISFDKTFSEAFEIIEDNDQISAKGLYNRLMSSTELSFLDKVNLLLLNDEIENKVNPDDILGSEYIKFFNPEDESWKGHGSYAHENVRDVTESIYLSWPKRVEKLNNKGPIAAKAFRNLTSFLTKEPFLGSYNIEPKNILKEIKGFKLGDELTQGFDLDLIASNIGNILNENLNNETYKVLSNMANVLNGVAPKNPIKDDPIWFPNRVSYFAGTDHMKNVLNFIQNPAILDKENEKMLKDQIELINGDEEYATLKLLENMYEFLKTEDLTQWYSANRKLVQLQLDIEDTDEDVHNIQDIIFPEISAVFDIYAKSPINFVEVTLPKGGGLNGMKDVDLIECNGEDLKNVKVNSTENSNLHFGLDSSFRSDRIKESRITGKGNVTIETLACMDSTIENIQDKCYMHFIDFINNKVSNTSIELISSSNNDFKNNTFNNCNIDLNVYAELGSKKIANPNTFNSCKIINDSDNGLKLNGSFNNCDIIQTRDERDVKISGNIKDCLIALRSNHRSDRISEFRFSDNGGHFDNVAISNMVLRPPQKLEDYDAYSATSLILHNCHWHNKENWTEEQHDAYKKLKLKLNIQEYGKDPLADISQGFMTTDELINFGDMLEDEISVKSNDFIDDVNELKKQKDALAKSYKRYVKKNDPQYDSRIESIKKEISYLNDKINSVHHEATTKYPIRSYFEDMPEQLYKAYLGSLESESFKRKLQQYIINNQVQIGKNYKVKLKEVRDAYDQHKKQMDDLEARNKSSLPTLF